MVLLNYRPPLEAQGRGQTPSFHDIAGIDYYYYSVTLTRLSWKLEFRNFGVESAAPFPPASSVVQLQLIKLNFTTLALRPRLSNFSFAI